METRSNVQLARLSVAIETAAELAQVQVDRARVAPILDAFADLFTRAAVSFRTTTRPAPQRGLNVRYVELPGIVDPLPAARAHGFIADSGHPIDRLLPAIQRQIPVLGYGVDFGVSTGFEKIWPFFPHQPQTLAALHALADLPPSVRAHEGFLVSHGFDDVRVFAIDYRHRTVNLYFMRPPGSFSPGALARLIDAAALAPPSDELLRHCTQAVPVYFTFSWDSERIERLCFGVIAPDPSLVPTRLDPLLARYTTRAPFAGERTIFIYSIAMTPTDVFLKIENDYSGTMTDLMRPPIGLEPPAAQLQR